MYRKVISNTSQPTANAAPVQESTAEVAWIGHPLSHGVEQEAQEG